MRNKSVLFAAAMLSLPYAPSYAADFSKIVQPQVIVNIVILFAALACFTIALKLSSLVRGGALAKGWQLWVVSFLTLAFGQLLVLAEKLEVFAIGFDIAGVLFLATVVLWFVGLMQTRKVLE